jgi:hypothetical protein
MGRGDIEEALAYCADDVVLELPYASGNGLERQYEGKTAVRHRVLGSFGPGNGRFSTFQFLDVRTCQLEGQNRVLAEYKSEGVIRSSGNRYANQYVTILTFVEGRITRWCEFFNPLAIVDGR